jgi:2-amino-4-hydroxy-6-hydroxymethyldihydropteridine diphosphokinase
MKHRAFVALGANLGDPATTLVAAVQALKELPDTALLCASSHYRTAPIGLAGQPDFINSVVALASGLDPHTLLQALHAIEDRFGRLRRERNGPRSLDLDLLLYDDLIVATPELTLPHPRLHLRAFVLVPLAEIAAADLRLPGRGSVAAWLPAVASQRIERLPERMQPIAPTRRRAL